MPKATVLDIVQEILGSMESDPVNSIDDTIESTEIVGMIQECFEDIVVEYDLGSQGQLISLEDVGDATKPTLLRMTDQTTQVKWINYQPGGSPLTTFDTLFNDFGEGGAFCGYSSESYIEHYTGFPDRGGGDISSATFGAYTIEGFYSNVFGSMFTVVLSGTDAAPPIDAWSSFALIELGYSLNAQDGSSSTDGLYRTWTFFGDFSAFQMDTTYTFELA